MDYAVLIDKQDHAVKYKRSICNISLGNLNLRKMVNGYPGDPIEKKPFNFIFCHNNVLSWLEGRVSTYGKKHPQGSQRCVMS